MNKVNDKTIVKVADIFDDAAMLYFDGTTNPDIESSEVTNYRVQKLHTNFYECFITVANVFMKYDRLKNIPETFEKQIYEKLDELNTYIEENGLNREELRRALFFIDIKAFKNLNFSLDIITPDAVSIIVSHIVSYLIDPKSIGTLLDPNIGTANLIYSIINELNIEPRIIGIDNHLLLTQVCETKANLMQTPMDIIYSDMLKILPHDIDLIVSDLASYEYTEEYSSNLYDAGVRYFPYLAIEHLLKIQNKVKMVFIIDNDFFSQKGSDLFRNELSKLGNLLCLIALPDNFFLKGTMTKSIIILDNNKQSTNVHTNVFNLPSLDDQKNFLLTMEKIKEALSD